MIDRFDSFYIAKQIQLRTTLVVSVYIFENVRIVPQTFYLVYELTTKMYPRYFTECPN